MYDYDKEWIKEILVNLGINTSIENVKDGLNTLNDYVLKQTNTDINLFWILNEEGTEVQGLYESHDETEIYNSADVLQIIENYRANKKLLYATDNGVIVIKITRKQKKILDNSEYLINYVEPTCGYTGYECLYTDNHRALNDDNIEFFVTENIDIENSEDFYIIDSMYILDIEDINNTIYANANNSFDITSISIDEISNHKELYVIVKQ